MGDTFNFNGSIGQFVKEGDGIIHDYHAQSVAASSTSSGERAPGEPENGTSGKPGHGSQGRYEVAAGTASGVRIAPGKKTSVLVMLNAMFKAGWFEAEDGGELRNRDVALNDILRHAFGIDKKTAISQTINPSNNIKGGEKNRLLLHRLLDEDEMEAFIKELQAELLDAYEEKE